MNKPREVIPQQWYAHSDIFQVSSDIPESVDLTQRLCGDLWEVHVYKVVLVTHTRRFAELIDAERTERVNAQFLTPIIVLYHSGSTRWATSEELQSVVQELEGVITWYGCCAESQIIFSCHHWQWPARTSANDKWVSFFNVSTIQLYHALVQKQKSRTKPKFDPSWDVDRRTQSAALKLLWRSPGVSPQAAVTVWKCF